MAKVVGCNKEIKEFDTAIEKGLDASVAFDNISTCLARFQEKATPAMKEDAKIKLSTSDKNTI